MIGALDLRMKRAVDVATWVGSCVGALAALVSIAAAPLATVRLLNTNGFLSLGLGRGIVVTLVGTFVVGAVALYFSCRRFKHLHLLVMSSSFALLVALAFTHSQARSLLGAGALLSAAMALGHRICSSLTDGRKLPMVVELGAGLSVIQAVLFAIGALHLYYPALGWLVAAAGAACVPHHTKRLARSRLARDLAAVDRWTLALVAVLLAPVWGWLAAPDLQFDALYAKQWLPATWAAGHAITFPLNHPVLNAIGSGLFLSVPGHLIHGGDVGRYLQALFGVVVIVTPLELVVRERSKGFSFPAWLAPITVFALATSGQLIWQMQTAYDDMSIVVLTLAATLFLVLLPPARWSGVREPLVGGLLIGGMLSTKLHVLVTTAALSVIIVVASKRKRLLTSAGLVIGGSAASALPFLFRWTATGNPVFPQLNKVFRSRHYFKINTTFNLPYDKAHRLGDLLALPARATLFPARYVEAVPPGGFGLLCAGFGLTLVLIGFKRTRLVSIALLAGLASWWSELRYLRYALPYLVSSICLLILAVARPSDRPELSFTRTVRRWSIPFALLGSLTSIAVCVPPAVAGFWNVPNRFPSDFLLGRISATTYVRRALPVVDAISYLNRTAGKHDRVVGESWPRSLLRPDLDFSPGWEFSEQIQLKERNRSVRAAWQDLDARWLVIGSQNRVSAATIDRSLLQAPSHMRFASNGFEVWEIGGRPGSVKSFTCAILPGMGNQSCADPATGNKATIAVGTGEVVLSISPTCPDTLVGVSFDSPTPAGATVAEFESGKLWSWMNVESAPGRVFASQTSERGRNTTIDFHLRTTQRQFQVSVTTAQPCNF